MKDHLDFRKLGREELGESDMRPIVDREQVPCMRRIAKLILEIVVQKNFGNCRIFVKEHEGDKFEMKGT